MDQFADRDQQAPLEQPTTPEQHANPNQQAASEQEPASERYVEVRPDQITPEGNEAFLHQHQKYLRSEYSSSELSGGSSHTGITNFPGSRHSSLNTEPLTLDAEQIHYAKDQAEDIIHKVDTDTAAEIFTTDLQTESAEDVTPENEQALSDQINTLVEKAQQVVEANEQQQSGSKLSKGTSSKQQHEQSEEEDGKLKED